MLLAGGKSIRHYNGESTRSKVKRRFCCTKYDSFGPHAYWTLGLYTQWGGVTQKIVKNEIVWNLVITERARLHWVLKEREKWSASLLILYFIHGGGFILRIITVDQYDLVPLRKSKTWVRNWFLDKCLHERLQNSNYWAKSKWRNVWSLQNLLYKVKVPRYFETVEDHLFSVWRLFIRTTTLWFLESKITARNLLWSLELQSTLSFDRLVSPRKYIEREFLHFEVLNKLFWTHFWISFVTPCRIVHPSPLLRNLRILFKRLLHPPSLTHTHTHLSRPKTFSPHEAIYLVKCV